MKKFVIGILLLVFLVSFQYVFAGTCGTNVTYTKSGSTMTFARTDSTKPATWGNCSEVIKYDSSVKVIKTKAPKIVVMNGNNLFQDLVYITDMDLTNLDVSKVLEMKYMFAIECSKPDSTNSIVGRYSPRILPA